MRAELATKAERKREIKAWIALEPQKTQRQKELASCHCDGRNIPQRPIRRAKKANLTLKASDFACGATADVDLILGER
ncbi:hypothetical protein [Campylobacter rectus]|nr:hypothetical protein [Campylobacter rectus]